jgi:hypothetical protein
LRIVHRNQGGKITERLVSLDGMGREYIRTNSEVTYYMPDKRAVLVESRADSEALLTLIPEYRPGLEAYYDISTGPVTKYWSARRNWSPYSRAMNTVMAIGCGWTPKPPCPSNRSCSIVRAG